MSDDVGPFHVFVSDWEPAPGRLDHGEVACAIGDVHGQLDHLVELTDWVCANALDVPTKTRHLILLGDYVDRGPKNIATLEFVHSIAPAGVDVVRLFGNHDLLLMEFLDNPSCDFDFIDFWTTNGGIATLVELGLGYEELSRNSISDLQSMAAQQLAPAAMCCLDKLEASAKVGTYLFVHAGVSPDAPVNLNDVEMLTTIREPFLSGQPWAHGFQRRAWTHDLWTGRQASPRRSR